MEHTDEKKGVMTMAITTYITECEVDKPIENNGVREWIEQVQKTLGPAWFVLERKVPVRVGVLRRSVVRYRYTVYHRISDSIECQVINFGPQDDSDWSINTEVTAQVAVAYLIGLISGFDEGKADH
jgi:hypothetical protein